MGRFRVNVFLSQGIPVLAMRHVKTEIPTVEYLRLPPQIKTFATVERGQRVGLIKFGSRVNVILPADAELRVKVGQRVKGGSSVLAAMNTASEQYNKIEACGADWNDAVQAYNTERNKIPGDEVGRIAEYLHVKTLPESLPYYVGTYKGSISQSNLPTPVVNP